MKAGIDDIFKMFGLILDASVYVTPCSSKLDYKYHGESLLTSTASEIE